MDSASMTLIVAADAQDHLILAGDHCAVMSGVSNQGQALFVLDNYRKMYPWKYGAIAASGDVFLMAQFHRLFLLHESGGSPIDLLQVAREAKQVRSRAGVPSSRSTGNIFFTLPGSDGFQLHGVFIRSDRIVHELIEPISTRVSTRENATAGPACEAFNDRLRPSFFFDSEDVFHQHHLDLLGQIFADQSAIDERVTASFDVCMMEKRTGICRFWHGLPDAKDAVSIQLEAGVTDIASGLSGRMVESVRPLPAWRPRHLPERT